MAHNYHFWGGSTTDKIYMQTGYTATIFDSAAANNPIRVEADADDTWWGDTAITWHQFDGQVTTTENDSLDASGVGGGNCYAITMDENADFYTQEWVAQDYIHKMVGFSTSIDTSVDVSAVDTVATSVTVGETYTYLIGTTGDKIYRLDGRPSSTVDDSISPATGNVAYNGVSWTGDSCPFTHGGGTDTIAITDGWSGTIASSRAVNGTDTNAQGASTDDYESRVPSAPPAGIASQRLLIGHGI